MPTSEVLDFVPVQAPDFVPVAPATGSEEFVPVRAATEDDEIPLLTRNQLVERAARAYQSGAVAPEALNKYKQAYRTVASTGAIFDEDRRPEDLKKAEQGPDADRNIFMRAGEGMFESLFTQLNEAGKALVGYDTMAGVPLTKQAEQGEAMANLASGVQLSATRSADMIRTAANRVVNKLLTSNLDAGTRAATYDTQFEHDLAVKLAEQGIKEGAVFSDPNGRATPAAESVETLSNSPLSDPTLLIPGAAGVSAAAREAQIAARVLKTGLEPAAKTTIAGQIARFAGEQAARPIEFAAKAARATGNIVDESPLLKAAAAAGVAGAVGGNTDTEVLAALLGANTKLKFFSGTSARLQNVADQLASRVPPGPMGRFAVSAYRTVSPELRGVVVGQLANTPFILGAGDEEAAKDMVAAGVLVHAATNAAARTVNGLQTMTNPWKPAASMPEQRMPARDYGIDPELDAAHNRVVAGLDNGDHNFVESVRKYFGDRSENYVLGEKDFAAQLDRMAASGQWGLVTKPGEAPVPLTPDLARVAKAQQGATLVTTNPETGAPRYVAVNQVRSGMPGLSVGHEGGHLLEHILSPDELRYIRKETLRYYGEDQAAEYYSRYQNLVDPDRNAPTQKWSELTESQKDSALSEIFAEHVSAVLNAMPIGQFSEGGPKSKDYARQVYAFVDRGLEAIGAKQPRAVGGTGAVKTGTGIEPSARLGKVVENVLQAKKLDESVLPGISGQPQRAAATSTQTSTQTAPAAPATTLEARINAAAPKPAREQPAIRKGDPVGELRNQDGVVIGEDAVVSKVNTDGTVDLELTHPDTGQRVVVPAVNQSELPVSEVRPGAGPAKTVYPTSPVTPNTPVGAATAENTVAPRQIENTTRPQPSNVRVTETQQGQFAAPAVDEVHRQNRAKLENIFKLPRDQRPVVETEYFSAQRGDTSPDAIVREAQRKAADAADAEAARTGKPNPLRAAFQKLFVPYRWTPYLLDAETHNRLYGASAERRPGGVFGMSLDKVAQNLDLLRGTLAANPKAQDIVATRTGNPEYLASPEIVRDLQTYLDNQAHGYAGDGTKLTRPADTREGTVTAEDPNFSPVPLPRSKLQVLNLLMGLEQQASRTVGMDYAERFAKQNGLNPISRGVDEKGRQLTDNNPLRVELQRAGLDTRILNTVVENLPTKNLTTPLKERTDLRFPAGDTAIMAAGFMPAGQTARRAKGNDETRAIAGKYIRDTGIDAVPHETYAPLNEPQLRAVADYYDQAKHEPNRPEVQKAYRALTDETIAQYRALQDAGIQIEAYEGKGEPYPSSTAMMDDVRKNKHLYFLRTEGAFGEGQAASDNPLLRPSGIEDVRGTPLLVNDVFRAVHDYFGHTAEGFEFGPRGEYNAYLAHSRMFSEQAKPALAAETLAQNAWVNFGPQMRRTDGSVPAPGDADFKPLSQRRFADQKTTIIPQEFLRAVDDQAEGRFMPAVRDIGDEPGLRGVPKLTDQDGELRFATKKFKGPTAATHFSGTEGIEVADPKYMGTGAARGSASTRMMSGEKKTFLFLGDAKPTKGENVDLSRPNEYKTKVDLSRFYDMDKDPAGLWFYPNPAKSEAALKKAGYDGFWAEDDKGRKFMASFYPVDLRTGEILRNPTDEAPLRKARIEKPAKKSAADLEWEAWQKKAASWTGFMPATVREQTQSPEFKNWFGDSKVVTEDGTPAVVFHGTAGNFNKFSRNKSTQGIFWFTNDRSAIEAGDVGAQGRGKVMDLFASIKNPAGWDEYGKKSLWELRRDGYDGAILPDKDGTFTGFAFEPEQLKSASKNRGTFDPQNADIRFMPAGEDSGLTERTPRATKGSMKATLDDFSPEKIQNLPRLTDWAILSAENPDAQKLSPAENAKRTAELWRDLEQAGYEHLQAVGKYGNEENSFIVAGITPEKALELARKYGQQSVLLPQGNTYLDGSYNPATGDISVHSTAPEDYYTTLKNGSKFTLGIDFDKTIRPDEKPAVETAPAASEKPLAGESVTRRGVSTAPLFTGEEPLPALRDTSATGIVSALAARSRKIKRIPYDSRTPATKQAIAETIADEIGHAMSQHDNARGWYESKVTAAMNEFQKLHPELKEPGYGSIFKAILAITSNGQKVLENAHRAEEIYREWKEDGAIDYSSNWGGTRKDGINSGLEMLSRMIERDGVDKTAEFLNKKTTVGELKKQGYPVSGDLNSHEVLGAAVFGPKVGAGFYANLQGDFSPITMDLWLMRTWNRINGSYGVRDSEKVKQELTNLREVAAKNPDLPESKTVAKLGDRALENWAHETQARWTRNGFKDPTPFNRPAKRLTEAVEGAVESPRNGAERAWIREVFAAVDRQLEKRNLPPINNADKQALLWYYEKDLLARFGYRDRKASPQDYATAAASVVEKYAKPREQRAEPEAETEFSLAW